jgi:mevalonate kinase
MGLKSYKTKAPGSLMLFGEHAVLHKKQAVVMAVDNYIKITLTLRTDSIVHIKSSEFKAYKTSIDKLNITKPYGYVLTAIKERLKKIRTGFTLEINSDFPSDIGFGSSAAVTVATLEVLSLWLDKKPLDNMKLYRQAVRVVRLVQGVGSGADVAASVFGGVIAYKMQPVAIKKIAASLPLVVVYSGSKLATKKVIAKVEKSRKRSPQVFAKIFAAIDLCSKEAVKAIKNRNYPHLGKLMDINYGLQEALGVSNNILSDLVFKLRSKKNIYGAKISGSGLGDCVIGLGKNGRTNRNLILRTL